MFNLEEQIQLWRGGLAESLGEQSEALVELESHLRDHFEQRVRAGQAPHEAWQEAVAKLGSPGGLKEEFAKLHNRPWIPGWVALGGMLICGLAMLWFVARGMTIGKFRALLAVHVLTVVIGYVAMYMIGMLAAWAILSRAVAGWDGARNGAFRTALSRLAGIAIAGTAIGIVLGSFWARDNLGRYWAWDAREVGGTAVLAWACVVFACAKNRSTSTVAVMVVAVMANVVVSLSWWGPGLIEDRHLYGAKTTGLGTALGSFVVAQLLIACAAMLPSRSLNGRELSF